MLFLIRHQMQYLYSQPVFLEPHLFRLCPRTDSWQHLLEYNLHIDPQPAGFSDITDSSGNRGRWAWFEEKTDRLKIEMACTVETMRQNPFDYLVFPESFRDHPFHYPTDTVGGLEPFLKPVSQDKEEAVRKASLDLLHVSGGDVFRFLSELNTHLYQNWRVIVRDEGPPLLPEETMQQNAAACRDLALLFMAICRHAGIASRFVSGYQEGDPDTQKRQLHAWCEVYIPGGGWRGYDPTHGLAVADRHVALASGVNSHGAAPSKGSFRGTGTEATMQFNIEITVKQ